MTKELTADDLKVGSWYRAKKPRRVPRTGRWNDRQIIHLNEGRTSVQYDGDSVRNGHLYPRVTTAEFLAWAGFELAPEDVDE